jgi:rRNA maturation RNase YbeY
LLTLNDTLTFNGLFFIETGAQTEIDFMISQGLYEQGFSQNASKEENTLLAEALWQAVPRLWTTMARELPSHDYLQQANTSLSLSIILVNNPEIEGLNTLYRDKAEATDVLTFNMTDKAGITHWKNLPELALGEIYLSLDYAREKVTSTHFHSVGLYLAERMVHGWLHLLGVHHDTMAAYHHVTEIQRICLDSLRLPPAHPFYTQEA